MTLSSQSRGSQKRTFPAVAFSHAWVLLLGNTLASAVRLQKTAKTAILSLRLSVEGLCKEQASSLEIERWCRCSHAFKEQALMWTGWGEIIDWPFSGVSLYCTGESGRSRSDKGTHTHIYLCKVVGEIKYAYYPGYCAFLARSCMTPSPLWTWCWVYVCVQPPRTLFSFSPHLWFSSWLLRLTLDSRKPVSDTGGNVSNYTGPVCEGYVCTRLCLCNQ